MPGLDGTGPRGMGPMTGGGRGWCNPYSPLYGLAPWPFAAMGPGGYAPPAMGMAPYQPFARPVGPVGFWPGAYGAATRPYGMAQPYAYGMRGGRFGIGRGRGMGGRGGW